MHPSSNQQINHHALMLQAHTSLFWRRTQLGRCQWSHTHDGDRVADPVIGPNLDRQCKFGASQAVPPQGIKRVARGIDLDVGPKKDIVPNLDAVAVQQGAVEIHVHALAQSDIVFLHWFSKSSAGGRVKMPS